jgi:dethiobiotin synthetase
MVKSCSGLFITGTDTGVGKTLVAAALVHLAAAEGRRVVGLKPVASGAERTADGLRNEDALKLQRAGSVALPYDLVNPYCFEPAIAPHLAAAERGVAVEIPRLLDGYRTATLQAELAIVEGAGGWRVPLHPDGFLSDLPEQLGLGVVLVVGLRLGCLNHARLTLEAIEHAGRCPFIGWIGNAVDPDFTHHDETVATLARLLGRSALAVVPAIAEATPATAAGHLDRPAVRAALGLGAMPRQA